MRVRRGWRSEDVVRPAPDAGMVTAEAAVVLPVLLVVALLAVAGVQVAVAQTRCLEAAAVAARLAARGEPPGSVTAAVRAAAPAGARATVATARDTVTATVRLGVHVPVVGGVLPAFDVAEQAVAPVEPASA